MIINLLKETEEVLKKYGYKLKHIRYIRNAEGFIPIADFVTAAERFDYDNGYGTVEVDPTIKIVGKFWWLTIHVYDGKECWQYHSKPKRPTIQAPDFVIQNTRTSWHEDGLEDDQRE